jgi:methionyl-tRNA formyltransferase
VHSAHVANQNTPAGERTIYKGFPAIGTAQGTLVLDEVQPAGKKAMPGDAFLLGARDWVTNN